jgi:hypothetical protein
MVLKKGSRIDRGYATVVDDEGINYRKIADMMTGIGFTMNHSSARNYVLRVMRKFASAYGERWGFDLDESHLDSIAKSPLFQQGVSDMIRKVDFYQKQISSN